MQLCDDQTIIAQCTPRGSGALALIRITGAQAISVADAISRLSSRKKLHEMTSHTIHYGSIIDSRGTLIDKVMLLLMRAPKTFTGQDTVEITCHNNQFIIEQIIQQAVAVGARLAQEGEFTKRAVLHGKIDIIQAEAINELIHAQTQLALKKSLAQLEGTFSAWIESIEKELFKSLALCQASFEFLDEEISFAPDIKTILHRIYTTITLIKKTYSQQQQIRQGIRIAIIGSVNAGKSSLFNSLLNQNRAIVTPIAGTTRDAIEMGLYKNGNFWTLIDTAGLRQTDDVIEQEGIARSFAEAQKADVILLVFDNSRMLTAPENIIYQQLKHDYAHKIITVYTKSDLNDQLPSEEHIIFVSNITRNNIDQLETAIEEKITSLFTHLDSPFLLNQRQFNLLLALEKKLTEVEDQLQTNCVAYELLAIHIQDAIATLSELTGRTISETGMDLIFREFCIGK